MSLALLLAGTLLPFLLMHPVRDTNSATAEKPSVDWGKLPLSFEPNAGQADPSVRFLARQPGGTLLFSGSSVYMAVRQGVRVGSPTRTPLDGGSEIRPDGTATFSTIRLEFVGANGEAT